MSTKLHRDPHVISHGEKILAELSEHCGSLIFATFLTDDGFEVTNSSSNPGGESRMAAMVSSLQALGDAVTAHLEMGDCAYLIVAAPKGYVIQMRVPGLPLMLAANFDAGETLGKALSVSRSAAASMGQIDLPETV